MLQLLQQHFHLLLNYSLKVTIHNSRYKNITKKHPIEASLHFLYLLDLFYLNW